jgi:ankyrin repeat protein
MRNYTAPRVKLLNLTRSRHYLSQSKWAPVHVAIQKNQIEVVKFLADRGADLLAKTGANGHTPEVLAQQLGLQDIQRLLKKIL